MSISIVVPAYNESENLPILIKEINDYLLNSLEFEIIIIDDFSHDGTQILFEKNKYQNTKYFFNDKNIGQSFSIIRGVKLSSYNTIVTIDGDLQNNPKDILMISNIYSSEKDLKLVGGIRLERKDNFIKIFSSKLANFVRNIFLNDECSDTGCSLKIFDKDIFLSFPFFDGIHRFLPALYKGFGHKTFFVNVDHRARIKGVSKYGTFERLFRGIRDLIKVLRIINKFKKKNDKLYSKP